MDANACRVIDHGTRPTTIAELTGDERAAVVYLLDTTLQRMRDSNRAHTDPLTLALWSGYMLEQLYENARAKLSTTPARTRIVAEQSTAGTEGNDRTVAIAGVVPAHHDGCSGGAG